jgi:Flp pilus assembly protein TadG
MYTAIHQRGLKRAKLRHTQRGIAMPLVIVGLLAILAVAGLALDSSHALANKTRLQNSVDAAALAAAKVLSQPSDTGQATAAAMSLLGQNANGPGNHEFNDAYDGGEISVTVEYSETSNPFIPGALNGPYVRVIAQNFNIRTTLSKVLNVDEMPVAASAVAGPSPTIEPCEIAPLMVCANDPSEPFFGFQEDALQVLKNSPSGQSGGHSDVGPGNFKLLRIDCDDGGGGACVRQNMAGNVDRCPITEETVETEPGATAGPTRQGFNTRFGLYSGGGVSPEEYPPDVVVTTPSPNLTAEYPENSPPIVKQGGNVVQTGDQINYSYSDYMRDSNNLPDPPPSGAYGRRVLTMPVADCSGDQNGQSTLDVEGYACFFMLQPIAQGGEMEIFGQFVSTCVSKGMPGPSPSDANGAFRIQLYKDPDSNDS